ncbi:MAG: ABC transporter ATP-binding protein [Bacillota bacterium]|nr:ABC transporter ATP-binding protein [Bacillota bacterium]
MNNILELVDVSKQYPDFTLDNVSFSLPYGSITGFIGENGAGKTTTLNLILNLISLDGGSIKLFGKDSKTLDKLSKEDIGVIFDENSFHENLTPMEISNFMSKIYQKWDQPLFLQYMDKYNLPIKKRLKELSKGMKVKFSIAAALSHHPKLLILDEAISALDPIMRNEILDSFLDFVQDEEHSILFSTHITTDLQKVADYIVFIDKGKIIFHKSKDELIYNYGIIRCKSEQFPQIDREDIIAYHKSEHQIEVLTDDREKAVKKYGNLLIDNATIEEIMMLYIKGMKI